MKTRVGSGICSRGMLDFFKGEELATETCRTLLVKEEIHVFRSQGEVRSAQMGCQMDGSWGATNRPPLASKITHWRVTLSSGGCWYLYIIIYIYLVGS